MEQLNRFFEGIYVWILKQEDNIHRSVALGISKTFPFTFLGTNFQLPVVRVKPQGSIKISVACGNTPDLRGMVENFIHQLPEPRMTVGDHNAHHPAMGKFPL